MKSSEAFKTISEAAEAVGVPQHVLRHWENVFGQVRPMRRAGGRRFYRKTDIELLIGIRTLLYDEKYSTKGVQKIFREQGAKYVTQRGQAALSSPGSDQPVETSPRKPGPHSSDIADTAPATGMPAELLGLVQGLLKRIDIIEDQLDEATLAIESVTAAFGPNDITNEGLVDRPKHLSPARNGKPQA